MQYSFVITPWEKNLDMTYLLLSLSATFNADMLP